jgi:hypothetical protein
MEDVSCCLSGLRLLLSFSLGNVSTNVISVTVFRAINVVKLQHSLMASYQYERLGTKKNIDSFMLLLEMISLYFASSLDVRFCNATVYNEFNSRIVLFYSTRSYAD